MKYHVAPKWDGEQLQTAEQRFGEIEAVRLFCEKWKTDDVSFAQDQVTKIYLYNTLDEARQHQADYGGEILEINDERLEIKIDKIEGFPTVRHEIYPDEIRRI